MKTKLFPLIAAALLAGCATNAPQPQTRANKPHAVGDISNPEAETPPFIGMTKAQALARYGEPKKRTATDEGENWVYVLNLGEVIGNAMIPFNFHQPAVRTGVLIFDAEGRVKKFNWDKETGG
jgi:hypothetical protein